MGLHYIRKAEGRQQGRCARREQSAGAGCSRGP